MKNIIAALLLLVGATGFAQPTSGDIIMVKIDTTSSIDSMLVTLVSPQTFESVLVGAFKTGDATKIAGYFGENIDLSILGKINIYSKSQAQQVLQHFFTEHSPKDFSIIHKGSAKSSKYFIGELVSSDNAIYRVTLNCKKEGSKTTITSLTIEEN